MSLTFILSTSYKTLYKGLKALIKLKFSSINLLMLIAVIGAFYLGEYEEATIVIVLYTLGERLEDYGLDTSLSTLQGLVQKSPKLAQVKGKIDKIPIAEVLIKDIVLVKPYEMIPIDGEVVDGVSTVDESQITGESVPKTKSLGHTVYAGTYNGNGYLEIYCTKLSKDSTFSKIIDITFKATKSKANTQAFIEKFSSYYTPTIMIVAVGLVFVPVVFFGQSFEKWFSESLTLLVIACPCALVISTPVAIFSAIGNASSKGILVKGGRFMEAIGRLKTLAMDKTRTLTLGKLKVVDVITFDGKNKDIMLACAAGIEYHSEHPVAQSIVLEATKQNLEFHGIKNFESIAGKGAKADCIVCYDNPHSIGNLKFISERYHVKPEIRTKIEELENQGKTVIVYANGVEPIGMIAVQDQIRPESKEMISALKKLDIQVYLLTGDQKVSAENVGKTLEIEHIHSEMLPEDKANFVQSLIQQYKYVGMLGDGINDAPALACSSVGLSMGLSGNDTAIEVSNITILNDNLQLIPYLIQLGKNTIQTIKINIALALITKAIFILLAFFGTSNLVLAIFADVGITLIVILNSLRIRRFKGV